MPQTTTRARRRRTPEVRREQIIRAAAELFAQRGFAKTTTKEIADRAGISEGTIYRYFGSKDDLLFAFLDVEALQTLDALLAHTELTDDGEIIRRVLQDRLLLWERNASLIKVVFAEALFDRRLGERLCERLLTPVTELVRSYIAQRAKQGLFCDGNHVVMARALVGLVFSFGLIWGTLPCPSAERVPNEVIADSLASLFLDGIRCRSTLRPSAETQEKAG